MAKNTITKTNGKLLTICTKQAMTSEVLELRQDEKALRSLHTFTVDLALEARTVRKVNTRHTT